ncbi:restriction endonuclease subunit S [Aliikangiella sp. IMCC44359]|uniref:restriction endonuclease subunit S n=1 Tax=Aliikangiella sp. IMCC44359 TaxID=3459125 RepID=UPI00403AC000
MSAIEKLITENIDVWSSAIKKRNSQGRGSSNKIELYGIKKLRELILELAVRGLLVPQDPKDEPASVLLEKIAKEKTKLIRKGVVKSPKALPEISSNEILYEPPRSWSCVRLGNVVDIVRGITFPSSEKSKVPESGRAACLRTTNVQDKIEWEDLLFIREKFVKRDDQYIHQNDIVMSMANSRELVGKVAIIEREPAMKTSFGGFLAVLRPRLLNSTYVMLFLRAPAVRSILIGSASQTTNIANISLGKLNPLVMAIPPLAEQHRIVAKVDELMSLCDQLESQQTNSITAHEQLVEVLLNTLTQSANNQELTNNWLRLAEHFDTLFTSKSSIEQLKKAILELATSGKLVPFTAIAKKGVLKEYLSFGPRNGLSPKESPIDTPYKVLRLGATSYGTLNMGEVKFVDIDIDEDSHLWLKAGDILLQRGNSHIFVGSNVLIDSDLENVIYPDLMMKLRVSEEASSEYVSLWLKSPSARSFMWQRMTGTSGTMPKISKKIVESIPIIIPPMDIQDALVKLVGELMVFCNQLKVRLADAQDAQSNLADALVEQAIM